MITWGYFSSRREPQERCSWSHTIATARWGGRGRRRGAGGVWSCAYAAPTRRSRRRSGTGSIRPIPIRGSLAVLLEIKHYLFTFSINLIYYFNYTTILFCWRHQSNMCSETKGSKSYRYRNVDKSCKRRDSSSLQNSSTQSTTPLYTISTDCSSFFNIN